MGDIQFTDLERQQARIRKALDSAIARVLDHGHYIMGPEVAELEERLCEFTGAKYCVSCASGTDALLMPLMAWELKPEDMVFVPPFTFFATAEMPALLGAQIRFVDIDPQTFNMRADTLESAIQAAAGDRNIRGAVIPVDLFGQPCRYEDILPIAKKYGLRVLEDAAQAFGSTRFDKHACNLGADAAATSFFPVKPLGCYGDGGAIFTNNEELAEKLRSIRVHGKGLDKYDNVRLGVNGRLDTLQAAILLAKMEVFPEEIASRNCVARWYAEFLGQSQDMQLPTVDEGNTSVWAQYCVLLPPGARDRVVEHMKKAAIPVNIYYPKPIHMLEAFAHLAHRAEDFPVALEISRRILALPMRPYLEKHEVEYIASILIDAVNKSGK